MGIVFQSFHLIPSLTALGNVTLPLEIAGDPDADAKAKAILQRVGLSHRETHYPMQLSGGEQQRVAIARAVVAKPRVLLADEPTGALDTKTGDEVMRLLGELHDAAALTLIIVTHDPEIAEFAHRQIFLRDGQIESDGRSRGADA